VVGASVVGGSVDGGTCTVTVVDGAGTVTGTVVVVVVPPSEVEFAIATPIPARTAMTMMAMRILRGMR